MASVPTTKRETATCGRVAGPLQNCNISPLQTSLAALRFLHQRYVAIYVPFRRTRTTPHARSHRRAPLRARALLCQAATSTAGEPKVRLERTLAGQFVDTARCKDLGMDAATFYILIVCAGGTSQACDMPFGGVPSLTRQDCIEHMWLIRAGNDSKRVICMAPDHMGGRTPPSPYSTSRAWARAFLAVRNPAYVRPPCASAPIRAHGAQCESVRAASTQPHMSGV